MWPLVFSHTIATAPIRRRATVPREERYCEFFPRMIRTRKPLPKFEDAPIDTMDTAMQRAAMIAYLEGALEFAEKLEEPTTAYLIERALDEARSKSFSSVSTRELRDLN